MEKVYPSLDAFRMQNDALHTDLPFTQDTAVLRTPLQICGKTVPNRLACQAMEGCDGTPDGSPDTLTQRRYGRFAKGGAGLIWFEATAVMEEGRANPRQLFIREGNLDAFKRLVADIKETAVKANGYEPVVIMQATHSGRYAKPNGVPAPLIAYRNPIFETMLPHATFLNTGRGAQVVEQDLIDTLKSRPDLTALLDVTDPEPPEQGSALYTLENCILTPHIAGSSGLEVQRMGSYMVEEYENLIHHRPCRYEVTLPMLDTMA